jgi:hypothetical protein
MALLSHYYWFGKKRKKLNWKMARVIIIIFYFYKNMGKVIVKEQWIKVYICTLTSSFFINIFVR